MHLSELPHLRRVSHLHVNMFWEETTVNWHGLLPVPCEARGVEDWHDSGMRAHARRYD